MYGDCTLHVWENVIKHYISLHYSPSDLIEATKESNVNIPQMADTLFERATNASWVVVFKALITTHHMMVAGNEVSVKASITTTVPMGGPVF